MGLQCRGMGAQEGGVRGECQAGEGAQWGATHPVPARSGPRAGSRRQRWRRGHAGTGGAASMGGERSAAGGGPGGVGGGYGGGRGAWMEMGGR